MSEARQAVTVPRWTGALATLVVVALAFGLLSPGFLSFSWSAGSVHGSLVDALDQGAPLALVALGMALVIATGGIDLSVGAVMAIAGALAVKAIERGEHPFVGALIGVGVGLACGAWNGSLVRFARIPPIVATLVLMVAGRGIAQLITEGQIPTVDPNSTFAWFGGGALGVPAPALIATVALVIVAGVARLTALGLFIEATGANREASRLAGVPVGGATLAAYCACGALAGLAGVVATSDILAADANNLGLRIELDAVLAVVIGGTALTGGRFSLFGAVLGAIAVKTLDIGMQTKGVSTDVALVVKAAAIIAIAALRSPRFMSTFARGGIA